MEKRKEIKILSPKLDVVFGALFGEKGSEQITKKFLEKILDKKIGEINLDQNVILRKEFKEDKFGILDILAKIEQKEQCNIELQIVDRKNIIERILYYWSRLYSRQIKEGENYKILGKIIIILITDYEINETKGLEYHSSWKIIEEKIRKKVLTDKLEIHIIEIPKIKEQEKEEDELLDWIYFLEDPNSERVEKGMKKNKELKEAKEKLIQISADERMQRIADLRQKAIMDEKAIYDKGLDVGIEQGIKQGIEDNKKEIARKMLKENIEVDIIEKVTDLSKEEIARIKQEK